MKKKLLYLLKIILVSPIVHNKSSDPQKLKSSSVPISACICPFDFQITGTHFDGKSEKALSIFYKGTFCNKPIVSSLGKIHFHLHSAKSRHPTFLGAIRAKIL